jgi:hypothetical protein
LDQPVVRDDPGDVFEGLQPGMLLLNNVRYDVRGIVQLGGSSEMARMDDSASVKGPPIDGRIEIWPGEMPDHRHPLLVSIPMNVSVKKLHFLHGTRDTMATTGTEVAAYAVRYSDGTTLDIPLLLGRNIGDRFQDEGSQSSVEVAWRGSNQKAREIGKDLVLFQMNWENPKLGVGISSIDFISREAESAPFLVSITAE